MKPYSELKTADIILRTFNLDVNEDELIWHKDKRDRLVQVVSGNNWKLQIDNELPVSLVKNQKYFIPKETFHRLIKGNTKLVIKILEL